MKISKPFTLPNEYLLAIIGFGTAENKPSKAWQMFANVSAFGKKMQKVNFG